MNFYRNFRSLISKIVTTGKRFQTLKTVEKTFIRKYRFIGPCFIASNVGCLKIKIFSRLLALRCIILRHIRSMLSTITIKVRKGYTVYHIDH